MEMGEIPEEIARILPYDRVVLFFRKTHVQFASDPKNYSCCNVHTRLYE